MLVALVENVCQMGNCYVMKPQLVHHLVERCAVLWSKSKNFIKK